MRAWECWESNVDLPVVHPQSVSSRNRRSLFAIHYSTIRCLNCKLGHVTAISFKSKAKQTICSARASVSERQIPPLTVVKSIDKVFNSKTPACACGRQMCLAARGVQLVCSVSQLNSSRVAESFKEYSEFMRFLAPATQGQLRMYSIVRLLALTIQGQ